MNSLTVTSLLISFVVVASVNDAAPLLNEQLELEFRTVTGLPAPGTKSSRIDCAQVKMNMKNEMRILGIHYTGNVENRSDLDEQEKQKRRVYNAGLEYHLQMVENFLAQCQQTVLPGMDLDDEIEILRTLNMLNSEPNPETCEEKQAWRKYVQSAIDNEKIASHEQLAQMSEKSRSSMVFSTQVLDEFLSRCNALNLLKNSDSSMKE